ncbi:MAG: hypothetical protein A3A13_04375 [Candidatus Yanofskybacteria bacterium RIFCSPLOWO2_01_FULL_43_22]|uniref:Uncharacterized protein n=1 Tax=Candidatus Yanofskybacteria bacterium RIFCSPLOWO2_01_FULL_43_22 TaxID=1802695 RepID=A0A1F8GF25_9BACT|nr:MAG: hypothetical protein A3A13_04375 [Candidatus Yanofskybacteria bacterium RIFCSPLOWO2_01_FULL_43_22]
MKLPRALGKFLCSIGLHWYGPIREDFIRSTGQYDEDSEFVVQSGVETCTRPDCKHPHEVWRQGWMGITYPAGMDVIMGPWMKLGAKEEKYINSLRYRQLMA